jgi:hypothetical protein
LKDLKGPQLKVGTHLKERAVMSLEGNDVVACDSDGEEENKDEDRQMEGNWGHQIGVEVRGCRSEMAWMR